MLPRDALSPVTCQGGGRRALGLPLSRARRVGSIALVERVSEHEGVVSVHFRPGVSRRFLRGKGRLRVVFVRRVYLQGCTHAMHGRSRMTTRPSHPCSARTEHAMHGCSRMTT